MVRPPLARRLMQLPEAEMIASVVGAARSRRLASATVRPSLLSVGDFAAARALGLTAVSEVAGLAVFEVPHPKAPWIRLSPYDSRTYTTSEPPTRDRRRQPASALRAGYRAALQRLTAEARLVGADGVVGVQLTTTREDRVGATSVTRFSASGTAVRLPERHRQPQPFLTTLDAAGLTALLRSGCSPLTIVAIVVGAVRFFDLTARRQLRLRGQIGELAPVTDLSLTCRRQAVADLHAATDELGGHGTLLAQLTTDIDIDATDPWCSAVTVLISDVIVTAGKPLRPTRAAPLTILPLT